MTKVLYHDINPYCCEWLRNLIRNDILPEGDIICGDISRLTGNDLARYTQCHFFCGIGGWPYALQRAMWPNDRPVWTGSCPCQPWSVSGKRKGAADPRDLWPDWNRLIGERLPSTIFGEQVTGTPKWLTRMRCDLENLGYAVGCMPMEAASAGADHFRDRYWFVADQIQTLADSDRQRSSKSIGEPTHIETQRAAIARDRIRDVVDTEGIGWGKGWTESEFRSRGFTAAIADIEGRQYVQCPDRKWRRLPPSDVLWMGTRVPARIPSITAIGNSIDIRPAIIFIQSYMELNR